MVGEKFVTSFSGLLGFGVYFLISLFLLVLFSLIYSRITPYREFALISKGDLAAACSFSGALLGFAIPLASAISHSVGLLDMVLWGTIALIVQVLTFLAVRRIFPAIVSDIAENHVAQGVFLGVVSVVTGLLNAACMTY
jgi:putative membrane protein